MTKQKTTKRALLISALAMLLSVTLLVGTTFAWFTDSVVSGNNVIRSGNLDIEVEYTLDGTTWNPLDNATNLFQKDLWEPGHTEVVALKIKNVGDLAFKYVANMNVIYEIIGKNKEGGDIKLSEILKVSSLVESVGTAGNEKLAQAFANEDGINYEKTAAFKDASVLKEDQELLPGEEDYLIIQVDMATTVGNEANHDGVNKPALEFGINVLATQYCYEDDTFGTGYDANAEYPKVIMSASQLATAFANGGSYKLDADIEVIDTITVSNDVVLDLNGFELNAENNASRPFEMADGASLTINGSGEEVNVGAYGLVNIPEGVDATVTLNGGKYVADTDSGSLVKPRGDGDIKIVMKDVEYVDTSANGRVIDATSYLGSDLEVEIQGGSYTSAMGFIVPKGSITDATIEATGGKNGYPAVYSMEDLTLENCTIKSSSHAVSVSNGATITVKDCHIEVPANALAMQVFSSGGTINAFNVTYTGKIGTTGPMKTGCVAVINIDGVEVYRKG